MRSNQHSAPWRPPEGKTRTNTDGSDYAMGFHNGGTNPAGSAKTDQGRAETTSAVGQYDCDRQPSPRNL
eukprot:15458858-Alexandrium_andersonii.AAC.1